MTPVAKAAKTKTKRRKKPELAGSRVRISFRRHLLPPLGGLLVAILIFGFFNSQLLSARIAYYLDSRQPVAQLDSQTIASPVPKDASRIIINSINVKAPIIFESQNNEGVFLQDLQNGVVHYPDTAIPGQEGNVAIFGHSSGQWWAPGNYKFVFTLLDKVKIGDKIFIDYHGTRYIYRVYDSFVVAPTNLSVLNQSSNHMLTLITCTPVGTSAKRLIIRAQQYVPKVSNDLTSTKSATLPSGVGTGTTLPGNDSSFWHNLRELF